MLFCFFCVGTGSFQKKNKLNWYKYILIDKTFTTSVVRTARHLEPSSWHCSSLFPLPLIRNVFNTLINMIFKQFNGNFMIFVLRMIFSFIRFINAALIKEEKLVCVFFYSMASHFWWVLIIYYSTHYMSFLLFTLCTVYKPVTNIHSESVFTSLSIGTGWHGPSK